MLANKEEDVYTSYMTHTHTRTHTHARTPGTYTPDVHNYKNIKSHWCTFYLHNVLTMSPSRLNMYSISITK